MGTKRGKHLFTGECKYYYYSLHNLEKLITFPELCSTPNERETSVSSWLMKTHI